MAGNDADAEDALQETFLAAWQAAGSFRGGDSARGWLLTIARHGLGRMRRLRVDEPARLIPLDSLGCEAGWGEAGGVPLPEDGKERRARLETALASLGQEDREIIVLRDLEGFSGEETAELLALGLAAMKTRLHRARLRLVATLRRDHG